MRVDSIEAREEMKKLLRGRELSTPQLAKLRRKTVQSTIHLLYAMRDEGTVQSKECRGLRARLTLVWFLVAEANGESPIRYATTPRDDAHVALAEALGMCLAAPREIHPTRVHSMNRGTW